MRAKSRLAAAALVICLLGLPTALSAQERKGASVVVACKDGLLLTGELIAVRRDSLLLLDRSGRDETIAVADILTVRIKGKSNAGAGAFIGFGVGVAVGIVAVRAIDDSPTGPTGKETFNAGFVMGLLGAVPGVLAGALIRSDKLIRLEGETGASLDGILARLRSKARFTGGT